MINPVTDRLCGACGSPLAGNDRQRYCNNTCRQKAHRVRREAGRERTCPICNTPIAAAADHRGRRPTYCGPLCQQAARLERIRAEVAGAGLERAGTLVSAAAHLELERALDRLRDQLAEIERTRRRGRRTDKAGADAQAYASLARAVRDLLSRA